MIWEFANLRLATNGNQALLSLTVPGETGFAQRHDLYHLIEQFLLIDIVVGSTTYQVFGPDNRMSPNRDSVEPYIWQTRTSQRSSLRALVARVPTTGTLSAKIKFSGGQPYFDGLQQLVANNQAPFMYRFQRSTVGRPNRGATTGLGSWGEPQMFGRVGIDGQAGEDGKGVEFVWARTAKTKTSLSVARASR